MRSFTTLAFRTLLDKLPINVQLEAQEAYKLWRHEPMLGSLRFKQVKSTRPPVYSVRIGRGYRAIGVREDDRVTWVWIGAHDDYDRLLKQWR